MACGARAPHQSASDYRLAPWALPFFFYDFLVISGSFTYQSRIRRTRPKRRNSIRPGSVRSPYRRDGKTARFGACLQYRLSRSFRTPTGCHECHECYITRLAHCELTAQERSEAHCPPEGQENNCPGVSPAGVTQASHSSSSPIRKFVQFYTETKKKPKKVVKKKRRKKEGTQASK